MALRILHIAPYGPEAWAYGGIPRVVAGMTDGLARRGHAVTLATTDACDGSSRLEGGPSAAVTRRVFRNLSNRAAYRFQAFTPMGFRRFLDRDVEQFDVVHLHACHNLLTVLGAGACARAGLPFVLSPNGTAPIIERRRLLKRMFGVVFADRALQQAARIAAVSQAEARQLEALGVPPSRVVQVPNPVELPDRPLPRRGGFFDVLLGHTARPRVLFLGKITPRKQLGTVVDALARLHVPDVHLLVAGNDLGGMAGALSRARALGVASRVHAVGLLRGADRLAAMADADLVVYPGRDEVFGLVACEALAVGTPVIVGADSGCGEIVRAVGGGLCVEPGNSAALAAAVHDILAAGAQWDAAAAAAALTVRERFDAPIVSAQLESLYESCLAPTSTQVPA